MANIKSAQKRILVSAAKKEVNNTVKSKMKTAIKKFEKLVTSNDKENAALALKDANRTIDIALSKKVITKNKAARDKARINKLYNTLD